MSSFANDPQKSRLAQLWSVAQAAHRASDSAGASNPAQTSDSAAPKDSAEPAASAGGHLIRSLSLEHESAPLLGHVLLDMLEESGFAPDEISAVGGCSADTQLIGLCVLFATVSRGLEINAFEFSEGVLHGPYVREADVVLVVDGASVSQIQSAVSALQAAGARVLALVQLVAAGDSDLSALQIPVLALFQPADLGAN